MKILVDENIPFITVGALRDTGHNVKDIRGTLDEGINDSGLWQLAQRNGRLLITTDKGFKKNRFQSHHGVLIIRLRNPNRKRIHRRVMMAIQDIGPEEWPNLIVEMRDNVRSVWRLKK